MSAIAIELAGRFAIDRAADRVLDFDKRKSTEA
jgi:hypothetical protein